MELVIVLGIVVVLALAATGASVVMSRRGQRRVDARERAAVEGTPTRPKAPLKPVAAPEAPPQEPVAEETALEEPGAPESFPSELEAAVRPRLRDRLGKARALLSGYFGDLRSRTTIDDEV